MKKDVYFSPDVNLIVLNQVNVICVSGGGTGGGWDEGED